MRPLRSVSFLLVCALPACIPYSVGTTARPTPVGEFLPSGTVYFIPGGLESPTYSEDGEEKKESLSLFGTDVGARYGIDEVSDIGLRLSGLSGVVLDYKRLLTPGPDPAAPAVAALVGAGVVNLGEHAHFEASLLASGRESTTLTPYGGVRAMQVVPLSASAVSDSPTIGIFGGVRLGTADLGISPELGIFYDRLALGLRKSNVIVVPSFTFHGSRLLALARRGLPW